MYICVKHVMYWYHPILVGLRLSSTALPSICFYTFLNASNIVNRITLSSDGALVAAGCADSSVRVWDVQASATSGQTVQQVSEWMNTGRGSFK